MAKRKQLNIFDRIPWFWLWGIIYLAIVILGLFWLYSPVLTILKLLGIALCLGYVFKFYRKDRLLLTAFLFTLCADVILALNNTAALGVLVFAFAQLAHFLRLCKKPLLSKIWLIVSCIILIIVYVLPIDNTIIFFGAVYGITLAANLGIAIFQHHREHTLRSKVTLAGFALFICCDLLVALSFFTTIGVAPDFLHGFADYLCWVFYLPSQVLLANSSKLVLK